MKFEIISSHGKAPLSKTSFIIILARLRFAATLLPEGAMSLNETFIEWDIGRSEGGTQ